MLSATQAPTTKHQQLKCNAHLKRELQAAAENGFVWAVTLHNYLKELLELKYQNLLTTKFYKKSRKKIERILDKILKKRQKQLDDLIPISKVQQKVFALVKRMKAHLSEFLAFAEHKKYLFSIIKPKETPEWSN